MNTQEKVLVFLLRLGGTVMLTAFLAILQPVESMAAVHAWLGLGEFPRVPIVDYLTRSIAALYGFHGLLLWIVSGDVRRYAPLVTYLGAMNLAFGAVILGIDLHAGMPWYWIVNEAPPVAILGAILLYLRRHIRTD